MRVWRSSGEMRSSLGCAGAFVCLLAACSSSDQPPAPGGASTDFDPSITGEDQDAATTDDAGTRDAAADAAVDGDGAIVELPDAPPRVDPSSERLVVSDFTNAKLYVVNAHDFSSVAELDASAGSQVVRGPSGRYAYVFTGTGSGVHVVDVGMSVVHETGMPARPALAAPSVLSAGLSGASPRSVLVGDSTISVSFGLEPRAAFLTEASLPSALDATSQNTGAAHEGVALTLGDVRLMTRRDDESTAHWALVGAEASVSVELAGCSDPYLAASVGDVGAVVCAEGIALLHKSGSAAVTGTLSTYTFADPLSARSLINRPGSSEFSCIVGASSVAHVAAAGLVSADLQTEVATIAYPARGKQLWVLAKTGLLSVLDVADLSVSGEPVDTGCVTPSNGPLPAIRFGASSAYLTCPAQGEVRELDPSSAELGKVHTLGAAPFDLAAFTF